MYLKIKSMKNLLAYTSFVAKNGLLESEQINDEILDGFEINQKVICEIC